MRKSFSKSLDKLRSRSAPRKGMETSAIEAAAIPRSSSSHSIPHLFTVPDREATPTSGRSTPGLLTGSFTERTTPTNGSVHGTHGPPSSRGSSNPSSLSTSSTTSPVAPTTPRNRIGAYPRKAADEVPKKHIFGLPSPFTSHKDDSPNSARGHSTSIKERFTVRRSTSREPSERPRNNHSHTASQDASAQLNDPFQEHVADPYMQPASDTYRMSEAARCMAAMDPGPPITHTVVGRTIPRFFCEAMDAQGNVLFPFATSRPTGYFTVLCLFCAHEEWILCQNAMLKMEELWRQFSRQGNCQFLAISRNQSATEVLAFRMGKGSSFQMPMAADPRGEIFRTFATCGVPRFYLLDNFYAILRQAYGPLTQSFVDQVRHLADEISGKYLTGFKFTVADPSTSQPLPAYLNNGEDAEDQAYYAQALGRQFPVPVHP